MIKLAMIFATALAVQALAVQAQDHLTEGKASFIFNGERVLIEQNPTTAAEYAARFSGLTPSCDPYCIAPELAAVGIETVVEPQVLDFLIESAGRNKGLLIDARLPADRAMGYIPGSVIIPHTILENDNDTRKDVLKALGARAFDDIYNFNDAQNLMIYDGGPSQNDAGLLISYLLEVGYPPEKLSYYRGGMQVWSVLALTIQE
jgi:rhodanese-related sulfurtransferase